MEKETSTSVHEGEYQIRTMAVIGGGSWATALTKIFTEKDNIKIRWWLRLPEDVSYFNTYHSNPKYLSSVKLDNNKIEAFSSIKDVVEGADTILLVTPAAFIEESLQPLTAADFEGKYVISSIKGMMPQQNLLVTDYVEQMFSVSKERMAVIGGPCHAEEVAMEKQSYLTVAAPNMAFGSALAEQLQCRFISAKPSKDIFGVEYAAVMKNIISIACGISHGLGYGDNFQAVLVSNSMREIKKFLKCVYKTKRDLTGSEYLGDLLVTCYSQFSRNRTFGNMIGRGYSVKSAQMEMEMIAEGYYAVKSIYEIAKRYEVEMPITRAVYHILYERISPIVEFKILKDKLN